MLCDYYVPMHLTHYVETPQQRKIVYGSRLRRPTACLLSCVRARAFHGHLYCQPITMLTIIDKDNTSSVIYSCQNDTTHGKRSDK